MQLSLLVQVYSQKSMMVFESLICSCTHINSHVVEFYLFLICSNTLEGDSVTCVLIGSNTWKGDSGTFVLICSNILEDYSLSVVV